MFKNRTILYTLLGLFTLLLTACPGTETPTDNSYDLTVFISDTDASGTVTSDDGLISCPGDCSETYTAGKDVVLTAEAAEGFEFTEWIGATCEGEVTDTTCSLTVEDKTDVTASFTATDTNPPPVTPDPVTIEIPLIACEVDEEDEEEDPNRLKCNDAEEFTGGDADGTVLVSSSDLELNYNSEDTPNTGQLVGVRFVPTLADIPTGAAISEAYVEFTPKASNDENAEVPTIVVKAEASPSPAEFSGSPENLSSRSVTDTGVEWQPAPWLAGEVSEATRTPNLASLLETIEWQPGSPVVFLFENDTTTASRSAFSGDPVSLEGGGTADELNPAGPRLFVTYTPPSGS